MELLRAAIYQYIIFLVVLTPVIIVMHVVFSVVKGEKLIVKIDKIEKRKFLIFLIPFALYWCFEWANSPDLPYWLHVNLKLSPRIEKLFFVSKTLSNFVIDPALLGITSGIFCFWGFRTKLSNKIFIVQ